MLVLSVLPASGILQVCGQEGPGLPSQMITLRMIHSVIASSTVPHTNGKGLRKPEIPACPLSQRAQTGTQINVMKVTGQSISAEAKTWPVDAGIGFLKSFMLDQLLIPE